MLMQKKLLNATSMDKTGYACSVNEVLQPSYVTLDSVTNLKVFGYSLIR